MYNEEVKERYIVENETRNKALRNQATILFNRCEPIETELDKDVATLTTPEIIKCFKSFNTVSLESLMNARSQYKLYTDWCIRNHIVTKDYQNHFNEISNDILKKCFNGYLLEQRNINRDYIYRYMDTLLNPAEKFVVLGLFEGIGANTKVAYSDFMELRIEDFDTEAHKLRLGNRLIAYSQKLYDLAIESANTYETVVYDKNGEERRIKLREGDDRIIKPACKSDGRNYKNIIEGKLVKIKKAYENPVLNIQTLKEAGRREMIEKLIREGKTEEEAFADPQMLMTYGAVSRKRYKLNYYEE